MPTIDAQRVPPNSIIFTFGRVRLQLRVVTYRPIWKPVICRDSFWLCFPKVSFSFCIRQAMDRTIRRRRRWPLPWPRRRPARPTTNTCANQVQKLRSGFLWFPLRFLPLFVHTHTALYIYCAAGPVHPQLFAHCSPPSLLVVTGSHFGAVSL